jgi:Beta/Gamma crystallin
MNTKLRIALAIGALALATQAAAQVTLYQQESFQGRSFTTQKRIGNLEQYGFNDRASSAVVVGTRWEVCDDARFQGNCAILRPGRYPSLASLGLNNRISSARAVSRNARHDERRYAPAPVAAQVTFYEHEGFNGRSFTSDREVGDFRKVGFQNMASSVDVVGERWEVCENFGYSGHCVVLRPGRYPSFQSMGLNDRASSVRPVGGNARIEDHRYAPVLPPESSAVRDYRRN